LITTLNRKIPSAAETFWVIAAAPVCEEASENFTEYEFSVGDDIFE